MKSPASGCARRVQIAPASRGPTHPARLGRGSRQNPCRESATKRRSRTLGAAARAGPGRCGRGPDAPGGGGLGREKRNFAGACSRGPGLAVARGGVGAGGGGRRHVGVCGKRGARAAPLRAGARAGTASVPPRPSAGRRPEGPDRGRRLGTGPRVDPEVVGRQDSGPQIVRSENFARSGHQGHAVTPAAYFI